MIPSHHFPLYVSGFGSSVLYGLPEIHKQFFYFFTFRRIFAANDTHSFPIAKSLVPLLAPLNCNQYTIESSCELEF